MSETVLSPQQQAVMDFVSKTGKGNLMIVAVAGAGKTFTLMQLTKLLYGNVAFMAFSKNISLEIEDKVDAIRTLLRCRIEVGTVHRFGRKALAKLFPGPMGRPHFGASFETLKRQEKCNT
jgi:superfamily I DNA/RNA helicase